MIQPSVEPEESRLASWSLQSNVQESAAVVPVTSTASSTALPHEKAPPGLSSRLTSMIGCAVPKGPPQPETSIDDSMKATLTKGSDWLSKVSARKSFWAVASMPIA